jgi:hypothetical protein
VVNGGEEDDLTRAHRRRKPRKPSRHEQAVRAWLEHQMQDDVAARLATRIVLMHAGLVRWMGEAEISCVLPDPFRLPGDERPGGVTVGGSVSISREPDDAMLALVEQRLEPGGADPERLDPVRQRLADRLGRDASWYLKTAGSVDIAEWEPLAVRLGDLIGDQVAANAVATSLLGHRRLVLAGMDAERKAARERWRRQAEKYVEILDEQPTKGPDPTGRPVIQSVGEDDVRRFG